MKTAKDGHGQEWVLVGDRIWSAVFLQCPKCNSGVHILTHMLEYEPESATEFGIEPPFRTPTIKHQPLLCQCGYILTHREIKTRAEQGYSIPSCVWVCPNCSLYQTKCLTLTKIEYKAEEGEEWKPESEYARIETFEGCDSLQCKKCHKKYIFMALILDDNALFRGLWSAKA